MSRTMTGEIPTELAFNGDVVDLFVKKSLSKQELHVLKMTAKKLLKTDTENLFKKITLHIKGRKDIDIFR